MDPSPPGPGRLGRRYLITGRVQGVGFRYFVLRRAQELGLAGWVRNRPGGAVEVEAWGGEAVLSVLESHLGTGPRSARVLKVEVTEISDALNDVSGFHIVD